jgi:potassium/sodium efflux P-type ATPase
MDENKEENERLAQMPKMKRYAHKTLSSVKTILGLKGTPLVQSLSKFALLLFGLAILLTIIVFSVNKFDVQEDVLIYGICVAVAIIPESLIAVLTITQSVGASAMARSNVLVRKITSLEAIGGVTNVCSDKTGTLTQGKMVATQAWVPHVGGVGSLNVVDVGHPYDPDSGAVHKEGLEDPALGSQNPLSVLLRTMALCNLSYVSRGKSHGSVTSDTESVDTSNTAAGDWMGDGEPTEVALHVLAMRFGLGKQALIHHEHLEMVAEYPFSSADKRMTVIYRSQDGIRHAFTKGATEVLLDKLTAQDETKAQIMEKVDEFASHGLRIMCFGYRAFAADNVQPFEQDNRKDVEQQLTFLGLVGIQDPPRPETAGAVRKAQIAGIKVHMLTGDHLKTAQTIARQVGILPSDYGIGPASTSSLVMAASDFDRLTEAEVDALEELPLVVARCSPETKVRMVQAMHRRKAFCVMTGDGVNDAPALKRANVGIAMGRNGTDVAKEASDMVLTDDNFASIVKAIEEGRRLFDNIQKVNPQFRLPFA